MKLKLLKIFLSIFIFSGTILAQKVKVMPKASIFIDSTFAQKKYIEICKALEVNPTDVGSITVMSPMDNPRLTKYFSDRTPEWGVALAVPYRNLIILKKPEQRPHHVLSHELTHIILHRAAKTEVPRWFDEGVAEQNSKSWSMRDDFNMANLVMTGVPRLVELEYLYGKPEFTAQNMYALAYMAVNYLKEEYGENIIPEIVKKSKRYRSFEKGFQLSTGISVEQFSANFKKYMSDKYGIVRILLSTRTLWIFIVFLFLLAGVVQIIRRKKQKRELERQREEKLLDFSEEE